MTAFTPLRDFEADYEVETTAPHRIRKIGSNAFVAPYIDRFTGYVKLTLNGRTYLLHRILAKHFLPNPENLPQVDHVDRDPVNNSIENLRWVSSSDNMRNRTVTAYGRREYMTIPPNDLIEITHYNHFEYPANKYFFCCENDKVVQRINTHKWRFLSECAQNGFLKVNMRDINGRNHQILMHKLIDHFRNQPAEDEE